jgi:hypothetical protein
MSQGLRSGEGCWGTIGMPFEAENSITERQCRHVALS